MFQTEWIQKINNPSWQVLEFKRIKAYLLEILFLVTLEIFCNLHHFFQKQKPSQDIIRNILKD
jgi:hypothetical protein